MKRVVIGIDEVGRGALAGPVVLAAVVLNGRVNWVHPKLGRIRDSKKLTAKRREVWCEYLLAHPKLSARVTRVSPRVIDRINISQAANRGALRLIKKISERSDNFFAWLDGGLVLPEGIPHRTVIRGDEQIPLIAAASIIAKVARDRVMVRLGQKFPDYGFAQHKGYGTRAHRRKIFQHGNSEAHRKSFAFREDRAGQSQQVVTRVRVLDK